MLGTPDTTQAEFVPLRRSVSPVSWRSTGFGAIRGSATACSRIEERPRRATVDRRSQSKFGSGSFKRSGVSPAGRQVDASVVGPIACRLAECSELVGVLVSATVAGELCRWCRRVVGR